MFHLLLAAAVGVSTTDATFVRQALASGSAEIAQGEIYSANADPTVAQFANRMVTDHGTANTKLLAIARSLKITVPNSTLPGGSLQHHAVPSPEALSPQERAARQKNPVAYFKTQVADHRKAIAPFKGEVARGGNAQIVAFAKQTLPVLETHLRLAQAGLKEEERHRS